MTKSINLCIQNIKEVSIQKKHNLYEGKDSESWKKLVRVEVLDAREAERNLNFFKKEIANQFGEYGYNSEVLAYALECANA